MVWFWLLLLQGNKEVSWEMAFRRGEPQMTRKIAMPVRWLDGENLLFEEPDGRMVRHQLNDGSRHPWSSPQPTGRGMQAATSEDLLSWAWVEDDDLYFQREGTGKRRLTDNPAQEQNPSFSPDGKSLAFTRAGNLFALDLASGLERQLSADGGGLVSNGYASWVYYEEIFGRDSNYRAFWWAPDSRSIAFMRFDDSPVAEFAIYHPEGQYGTWENTRYPKAGHNNPVVRFGVVDLDSRAITWLDFDPNDDAYLAWPFWTADGSSLHVQRLNRGQDHLQLFACDPKKGSKQLLYEEKQKSWVEFFSDITYLQDRSGFLLRSDADGYAHLYYHDMNGRLKVRLSSGPWSVSEIVGVDESRRQVYFMANREDSAGKDLYRVGLDGKGLSKLTEPFSSGTTGKGRNSAGTHRVLLSPDFSHICDVYSDFWTPNQVRLGTLTGPWTLLDQASEPAAQDYARGALHYFEIPGPDGFALPAWWILPPDFKDDGSVKYGVIFRIYSGPGMPTVVNAYRSSWRDHFYASKGIITISVDHRASGHFGKRGMAALHRRLGHFELLDLRAAAAWLRAKPFIDTSRIGITGHSYGGTMTLLAMTGAPDLFTHGVAGAPVTDWALYDTVYTERYMDTPAENPEGYAAGSIISRAEKLKGPLRLIHGGIDDNVHFQNTAQLVEAWTNQNIPFEFMLYPGSRHGIRAFLHNQDGENRFWFTHFLGQPFQRP